jgi:hypothetical protein
MIDYHETMKANERMYMYGDLNDEHSITHWTSWNGAKKHEPRPSGLVDVVLRSGAALMGSEAATLNWKHIGRSADIVRWRHAQEVDGYTFPITPEKLAENKKKPTNPKDSVGIKKAPMSTVSSAVLAEVGVAMLEGALKYGRHNYRGVGVRASVYYDATIRHMFSWWEGEDKDPDSGMSHITKAIASLVVLRDAMIQSKVEDDRPPRSVEFYAGLNEQAAKLIDQYGSVQPYHYTIANDE